MERYPFKIPDENAFWKLPTWEKKNLLNMEIIREAEEQEHLAVQANIGRTKTQGQTTKRSVGRRQNG